MRKLIRLAIPLMVIIFISCGERKNAVISQAGYEIVVSLPPIGIFRHLYIDPIDEIGYLSADYAGLITLDLSNPESPVVLDTLRNEDFMAGGAGSSFYSHLTNYIYVEVYPAPSGGQIKAFISDSIETAMGPVLVGASPPVEKFSVREFPRDSAGITIVDSIHLYIADLNEITAKFYKQMYRRTGENNWTNMGSANYLAYSVYDFALKDSIAFLAVDEYGMVVVDMNSSTPLPVIGAYDTEGFCRGIDIQGNYCYLADRYWGLQILDVSDPMNPVRVSNLLFSGDSRDCIKVKAVGSRAVVLDEYRGVYGVDISNPANPVELFNFDTVTPTNIFADEGYIYVIDEDAGLIIAAW